jgi:CHAT domain-containing protein/tetratricopeptide (TPR) repeat protein
VLKHPKHNPVKRYLLKQLSDPEQQEIELRLLTDDDFSAELDAAEDELIDEYLANELSPDERERFEQNFLTTPERNSKLKSGQAMKRHFDRMAHDPLSKPSWFESLRKWLGKPLLPSRILPSPSSVVVFSSPASVAITFLVLGFSGLVIWYWLIQRSDLEKGLLALNEAYRQERPVEARISNLDYARFEPTRGNKSDRVDMLELNRAQRFLLDAEKERADAASYHALGKLYLLQSEYDKAIEYLDKATKADTKNAQIYADLGAAYLERGKLQLEANGPKGKGLEDLGRSLEYLKQSLELNPSLLLALFNRALVHEAQNLDQEAEADWRAYLEKDPSSQWAVEAQKHLKFLEEKKSRRSQNSGNALEAFMRAYHAGDDTAAWEIYRRSYTPTGNDVTKALLDLFLANNDESKSTENLQALNYLGRLETQRTEDVLSSDLAKVYASATPRTKALLLQARQQVVKGYELFNQSKIDAATTLFASARSTFETVGNLPELLATDTAIARGAAIKPDLAKGQELLARIVSVCESRNYKWLLAQALTARAHIQSNLNNYSEAISDGNRALGIFQELKDLSGTLGSFIQLASLHLFLNDIQTSFSFLQKAMTIAREDNALPRQQWGVYIAASLNLNALQLYRAALDYQHEALQLAFLSGIPLLISRSYQNIGLTYGSLRQFDLAFENVHRAYEQGRPLAAEPNGQNMMANASLRLGDLYRITGDENNALAAYEESSRLYEALNFAHYNYAAHKGKFLSYLAQNNDSMAWQELQLVLKLFDEYREKILGERQKSFFFDREQDIYDLAIDFAYFRQGDQRRAFDYSEICRARNLRELMQHGAEVTSSGNGLDLRTSKSARSESALPPTVTEIQQQLPERVQIVQYAVLEKKLLVWYITRSEIFTRLVEVDSLKLTEMVATALNQIKQRDENGATNSLKSLHNILIEPISGRLDSNLVVCFVPDKILHYVPFGALISMSSGRYLMQDYRVMSSPSATILIESTNKARELASIREERLLAVGNPAFDRSVNPSLSNLRDAEREVKEIAPSYTSERVLVGSQATRKSVMDELVRAHVAHFAAHYQIDADSQLASRLLLSPEPGERSHAQLSGLDSGDIYQMNLARTKLVVLSACQTGIEQQLRGEGPIGFARSFLVAGVPVVVASLWPVDSEATSELMILFHRFRKLDHLSTTEALTRAQQEMTTRGPYRHPYYWAGFTAIGGYSEF